RRPRSCPTSHHPAPAERLGPQRGIHLRKPRRRFSGIYKASPPSNLRSGAPTMRLPLRLFLLSAMCLATAGASRAEPSKPPTNIGSKIENVRLTGLEGKSLALADLHDRAAIVAV